MIRKLNKKIIKRLRHPGSSSNFLNKFLYNFERSDLEANGIKSLRNLNRCNGMLNGVGNSYVLIGKTPQSGIVLKRGDGG
jgi:hypothetical protein